MSYDIVNVVTGRIGCNCIPEGDRTHHDPEIDPRWTLQELREELGVEAVVLSEVGIIFDIAKGLFGVADPEDGLSFLSREEATEEFLLTVVPETVQDVINIMNNRHRPAERPDWYTDWVNEWESYDSDPEEAE